MEPLLQFRRRSYLNLETFRKSGEGVRTPVWFVEQDGRLYVETGAGSGKVKRIRRDGRVTVAACRMDGRVTGTWVPARAREVAEPVTVEAVDRLLDRKYGLIRRLFDSLRDRRGMRVTILEITLVE